MVQVMVSLFSPHQQLQLTAISYTQIPPLHPNAINECQMFSSRSDGRCICFNPYSSDFRRRVCVVLVMTCECGDVLVMTLVCSAGYDDECGCSGAGAVGRPLG